MRIVVGGRAKNQTAASASEMARFETETLSSRENLQNLIDLSGKWIDEADGDGQNGLRVVAVRSGCAGGVKFGG